MPTLIPTAEITLGPFFPTGYVDAGSNDLASVDGRLARGETIELHGTVTQHDGAPLHNVVLEIWQADAQGIFADEADPRCKQADPNFFGWGRAATDAAGRYRFRTIRPGRYRVADGTLRAAHINLLVLFSGVMRQLQTVVYFEDGPGNDTDPVFAAVAPPALRERLIARREAGEVARYRFDIRLSGEGETVFFED